MSDFIAINNDDKIIYQVVRLIKDRADKGLQTYGVTMDRNDLTPTQWMQHAIEEALDLAIYLMKIKCELDQNNYEQWHFKMSEQGFFDKPTNEE